MPDRRDCSPPNDLWTVLDRWQPEPISVDFNRRLYSRLAEFNRSERSLRKQLTVASPIGLALLGLLLTIHSDQRSPEPVARECAQQTTVSADQAKTLVQTLSDLDMLKQIDSNRLL